MSQDQTTRSRTQQIADLALSLRHAIVTASNDDYTRPGTQERQRHVARIDAMAAAADFLMELADHA